MLPGCKPAATCMELWYVPGYDLKTGDFGDVFFATRFYAIRSGMMILHKDYTGSRELMHPFKTSILGSYSHTKV